MKINTKIILLVVAIVAVVAILFSQSSRISAADNRTTLAKILNMDTSVTQVAVESVSEAASTPDTSNLYMIDQTQAAKNAQVIAQAKQLIDKAEKQYLTPGWLHTVTTSQAFVTEQKTLPDGTLVPTWSVSEDWSLLDQNGDVIKSVSTQDVGDPRLFQASVYADGISTNLSLGTSVEQTPYHMTFGSGILDISDADKQVDKFSTETAMVGGQKTVVFIVREDLKTPVGVGKDTQSDNQMYVYVTKYYFSAISGLPVQVEIYQGNSAGALKILSRDIVKITEKVATPPAKMLAYFTK
ncbi:MAG: hypothetical protein WA821_02275 [Anaerolineales bacterium]